MLGGVCRVNLVGCWVVIGGLYIGCFLSLWDIVFTSYKLAKIKKADMLIAQGVVCLGKIKRKNKKVTRLGLDPRTLCV